MNSFRYYSVVIALLSSTLVLAQNPLKRGVYRLGGSVSFYISDEEYENVKNNYTVFSFEPTFGYFVTDNISLFSQIGFNYSENESSYNNGPKYKGYSRFYSIGASVRYYFNAEKFIPFLGIGAEYLKNSSDYEGKRANISCGINYFLSKEVALEPYLSYTVLRGSMEQKSSIFRFGVSINYYLTE